MNLKETFEEKDGTAHESELEMIWNVAKKEDAIGDEFPEFDSFEYAWNHQQEKIDALQARVEELEKSLKNREDVISLLLKSIDILKEKLKKENQRLKDELKLERECVDFYADEENWGSGVEGFGIFTRDDDHDEYDSIPEEPINVIHAKRARQRQKERREE